MATEKSTEIKDIQDLYSRVIALNKSGLLPPGTTLKFKLSKENREQVHTDMLTYSDHDHGECCPMGQTCSAEQNIDGKKQDKKTYYRLKIFGTWVEIW